MRSNSSSPFTSILAALISFLMAAIFVGVYSKLASAANLNVKIDQAHLVRLDKPGAEVIIGNPSIADVSVQSSRLLVITGKSAGLTNLIVLDGNGDLIMEKNLYVETDVKNMVTLSRGASRSTLSCSPNCSPALIPGDSPLLFEALAKTTRTKLGLAQSAADGTTSQQ